SNAQVIDVSKLDVGDKVVFGATVELVDLDTDEEKTWQIVGDLEADIKQGLIAISSPVARALIGKHAGDEVSIDAPGGTREYEIATVRYIAWHGGRHHHAAAAGAGPLRRPAAGAGVCRLAGPRRPIAARRPGAGPALQHSRSDLARGRGDA